MLCIAIQASYNAKLDWINCKNTQIQLNCVFRVLPSQMKTLGIRRHCGSLAWAARKREPTPPASRTDNVPCVRPEPRPEPELDAASFPNGHGYGHGPSHCRCRRHQLPKRTRTLTWTRTKTGDGDGDGDDDGDGDGDGEQQRQ